MAWTAPMTAVAGATFAASQFNQHVRDNLNETAPAKATAEGQLFVSTGPNAIASRQMSSQIIQAQETTSSTSYTDLATAGPLVTLTTGTRALCLFASSMDHSLDNGSSQVSVAVTGASTIAANSQWCIQRDGSPSGNIWRTGMTHMFSGLTPGTNTFILKYAAVSGGTATFINRELIVIPF